MKALLKALNIFFVFLGVVFFIILIVGGIYLRNLYGGISKFKLDPAEITQTQDTTSDTTSGTTDKHPYLDATQEKQLEAIGIDPAKLPTTITPEMINCFESKLGADRTKEIIGGSEPTPFEVLKASSCL